MLRELWYGLAGEVEWLFMRVGFRCTQTIWPRLKSAGFNFCIAGNMLLCATLFAPWSKPRETISGFVGRQALMGSATALRVAKTIDSWYKNEPAHCGETALAEDEARFVLYPDDQVATENIQDFNPENNPKA